MASSNNSKVISDVSPHTIKKFELIETYIKSWAQKLLLTDGCNGIIFIDCMCNSGVYKDDNGNIVFGTPVRVAAALLDAARRYPSKQVHLFFNDLDSKKIDELKKHLPQDERNYQVVTTTRDGNELLKWIGPQLYGSNHMHYFLLYDPFDASIDWEALTPFFRNWGEVLINHMVSDTIRAISQVKREQTKRKYTETYQVEDISELVPYGSNKAAYENRIREIINKLKGSEERQYFVAAFPFFNTRNALVYDLVHCTSHKKGFKLFKSTAWKTFGGKSSAKTTHNVDGQLMFDFLGEEQSTITEDKYCYTLDNIAQYLQRHFCGQTDVSKSDVWAYLENHPVFPSDGYARELCSILKESYGAKISRSTISFSDRRS